MFPFSVGKVKQNPSLGLIHTCSGSKRWVSCIATPCRNHAQSSWHTITASSCWLQWLLLTKGTSCQMWYVELNLLHHEASWLWQCGRTWVMSCPFVSGWLGVKTQRPPTWPQLEHLSPSVPIIKTCEALKATFCIVCYSFYTEARHWLRNALFG